MAQTGQARRALRRRGRGSRRWAAPALAARWTRLVAEFARGVANIQRTLNRVREQDGGRFVVQRGMDPRTMGARDRA